MCDQCPLVQQEVLALRDKLHQADEDLLHTRTRLIHSGACRQQAEQEAAELHVKINELRYVIQQQAIRLVHQEDAAKQFFDIAHMQEPWPEGEVRKAM